MNKKFKFTWCPTCKGYSINCPKCGNNSCNGSYGKINGVECDLCVDVYNYQDENFPWFRNRIKRLFVFIFKGIINE